MINNRIYINTLELQSDYSQFIDLPKNSKILDLVRRNVHGHCAYTLVYQYEESSYPTAHYELLITGTGYEVEIERSFKYLTNIQHGYDESNFSLVHWRRILTDSEKRELKIDHILT